MATPSMDYDDRDLYEVPLASSRRTSENLSPVVEKNPAVRNSNGHLTISAPIPARQSTASQEDHNREEEGHIYNNTAPEYQNHPVFTSSPSADRCPEPEELEEVIFDMSANALTNAVSRLEAVASRLECLAVKATGGGDGAAGDSEETALFVQEFDNLLKGSYSEYLALSGKISGDVLQQSGLVKQAFTALRGFLVTASKCKTPSQNGLMELLKPLGEKIQAIQEFREKNRGSSQFNHLSAISESIGALGWVSISPTPGPYVKELCDAGVFYTNRVLKDYKDKDQTHVDWTKAWVKTLTDMGAYIKQHHTTGVAWNPRGQNANAVIPAPPPPPAGVPPPPGPPPPPPPPGPGAISGGSSTSGGGDNHAAALFAEINKGSDITKGLKRVTDDMKTHKNPGLRQGPAPFKPTAAPKPAPSAKPAPAPAAQDKPPVINLVDKKWMVEYHKGNKNIVLDNVNIKQVIYVYKCVDCTVQVKGKVNSVILDSCKKTALVFEDVIASVEFVNCQSVQAQVLGKVPTVSVDKTDGFMMYLSKDSLGAEIVTAKSSEMNVLVPLPNGDFKEFPIPEQFKTKWNGTTLVTTISDSV